MFMTKRLSTFIVYLSPYRSLILRKTGNLQGTIMGLMFTAQGLGRVVYPLWGEYGVV